MTGTRYNGSDVAYGVQSPDGRLLPMASAEPDSLAEFLSMAFGIDPRIAQERLNKAGYVVVPVRIEIDHQASGQKGEK